MHDYGVAECELETFIILYYLGNLCPDRYITYPHDTWKFVEMSIGLLEDEPVCLFKRNDVLYARGEYKATRISSADLNSFIPLPSKDYRYDSVLALIRRKCLPLAWVKIVPLCHLMNNKYRNSGPKSSAIGTHEPIES
jgi:hypothetical protein